MRLAMVATPAALPDLRPAPGSLDGDVIRARLSLPDASFCVVDLDPAVDLAEQIDLLFDRAAKGDPEIPGPAEPILFYASCRVILSVEGELFLSLDPAQPDTGDSLHDLALLFRERARAPVAIVLECRHAPDPEDPFRSAAVVGAAKEALAGGAIELLVAARPLAADDAEERSSPLTHALIEALDDPDAERGLTLAAFVAAARDSAEIALAVPCFAHAKSRTPFALIPLAEGHGASEPPPASPRDGGRAIPAPRVSLPELSSDELEPAPDSGEEGGVPAADPASQEAPEAEAPAPPRASAPILPGPPDAPPVAILEAPGGAHTSESAPPPARAQIASIPVLLDEPEPRPPFRSVEVEPAEDSPPSPEAAVDRAPVLPEPPSASVRAAGAALLPEQRSFLKSEPPPPPRVILSEPPPPPRAVVSEPPPPRASEPPPPARPSEPSPASKRTSAAPPKVITPADHVAVGDALKGAGDFDAALTSYKRALATLGGGASADRAEIYVRLGQIKQGQEKRREAIANYEKALSLFPTLDGPTSPSSATVRATMEALIDLNVAEGDQRAVAAAEEQLLATLTDPEERFARLVEFGSRWQDDALDPGRARAAFERARALKSEDTAVLERLAALYQEAGGVAEALMTRQRLAALTRDPRERAERYFALGKQCLHELRKEDLGLELLDLALESDPTMLDPLALVARVLADRQEWSQLEQAYRRMLERVDHIPKGPIRTEVTFELCRRLGLLFRDHLEDPALGLDAFEDAVHAKPKDLAMVLSTADLARSLGKHDKAAHYLERAAPLDPARVATYHDLFEAFQKLRRPDQAYHAASVTMFLRQSDARERFIFEEHKPEGVPKPQYVLPPEGWEWLRPRDADLSASAVLSAVTPAAIAVRLAQLAAEGRLPAPDPSLRQDPETSTVSVVRSFAWASRLLSVPAPAIYLNDDRDFALASVIAEEPTVIAGVKAQRGRSLPELAFLVGRHLAYHMGAHRLLLYYPSIEELTNCFLAAIRIVLPEVPAPPAVRAAVAELERGIALRLTESTRVDLAAAVAAFEKHGSRVHLAEWAGDVERCATRAGFVLSGDLEVAAALLRGEPRAVLEPEEKVGDLCAFAVSEEHHALREALGIAIQP